MSETFTPDTSEDNVRPVKQAKLTTSEGREITVSLINDDRVLSIDAVRDDGEKTGTGIELSAFFD